MRPLSLRKTMDLMLAKGKANRAMDDDLYKERKRS